MNHCLMELRISQIVIFLNVAETSSFTKAGEILHLTQSAISKSVLSLEKELGFKLFQRTTKEISLTSEGDILFKEWMESIRSLQDSYEKVSLLNKNKISHLNIGIACTTNPRKYFTNIAEVFLEKNADVRMNVESDEINNLRKDFFEGKYDLIFVPDFECYSYEEKGYLWKWVAKSNVIALVPKGHRYWERESISIEDIKDEIIDIMNKEVNINYYYFIKNLFKKYGYKPKIGNEYKNLFSITKQIKPYDRIIMVDEFVDFVDIDKYKRVSLDDNYNGIICVYKNKNNNIYIEKFIELIKN